MQPGRTTPGVDRRRRVGRGSRRKPDLAATPRALAAHTKRAARCAILPVVSRKPSYREIARQPAAGAAAGLVVALLYDSVSAVQRVFRRRNSRRAAMAAE